jgi:hypothetical protein
VTDEEKRTLLHDIDEFSRKLAGGEPKSEETKLADEQQWRETRANWALDARPMTDWEKRELLRNIERLNEVVRPRPVMSNEREGTVQSDDLPPSGKLKANEKSK